jgi:SAM-dependent methyltransferase
MTATSFHEFEQAGWNDAGTAAHYDRLFSSITTQTVPILLQAARVQAHCNVLDVATGPGYAAGAALACGARVTAIDFSLEKLALARARYPDISFLEGDALCLAFPDVMFDAVICNFGVPHFADARRFMAEAFRVLRPGGTLAFSTWDHPVRCRGFGVFYESIAAHGNANVGLPPGPDFFHYSDPQVCRDDLQQIGFQDCRGDLHELYWTVAKAEEVFEAVHRGSVRAGGTLRRQSEAAFAAIRQAVCEELEAYRDGEVLRIPMPAVIASGRKPA